MADQPINAREELRALIAAKANLFVDARVAALIADEVLKLTYEVSDEWRDIDITAYADLARGERAYLANRFIVVTIPREGVHRTEPHVEARAPERVADRRVE